MTKPISARYLQRTAKQIRSLAAACLLMLASPALADDFARLYDYMVDANKAQVVMLAEEGLVSRDLARRLADALSRVEAEGTPPQGDRSYPNYLDLEQRLKDLMGDDASNIHLGRSRNDLGAVMNLMLMRQQLLDLAGVLAGVRSTLQAIAADNIDTVVPGFTHGVQAQPTTLAHVLLALDASFQRDGQRLQDAYRRVNRSPLGSGAFTTSGFALDRERLAELLGFPALVENAYDAIMLNPADTKVEMASALSISALSIGRFAQYVLFQYDDPEAGLLLSDTITGRSSIMPQKRSPSIVERLRLTASEVVGRAHTSTLMVHNTPMYEVKDARQDHLYRLNDLVRVAAEMYEKLDSILKAITVRPDLLRKTVDRDYSTMTELADTLKREADVPFRIGHEVASELTTYGRQRGMTLAQISFEEVASIYEEVVGEPYPLTAEQTRKAFDAGEFVMSRKGIGGPQPAEARRMLEGQRADVEATRRWIAGEQARLEKAGDLLDREFKKL